MAGRPARWQTPPLAPRLVPRASPSPPGKLSTTEHTEDTERDKAPGIGFPPCLCSAIPKNCAFMAKNFSDYFLRSGLNFLVAAPPRCDSVINRPAHARKTGSTLPLCPPHSMELAMTGRPTRWQPPFPLSAFSRLPLFPISALSLEP